jgi:hypothetical protein
MTGCSSGSPVSPRFGPRSPYGAWWAHRVTSWEIRYIRMSITNDPKNTISHDIGKRIQLVTADLSARKLGKICQCSGETARRYRLGESQSPIFLNRMCEEFRLDGHWLLTGTFFPPEEKTALRQTSTQALMDELSQRRYLLAPFDHSPKVVPYGSIKIPAARNGTLGRKI